MTRFLTLVTLALLLHSVKSLAQDTTAAKYPTAVLVQLRSEYNRVQAFTKARNYKQLEEVKKDAQGAASKMIADFSDNLLYCPVYYYIDTNIELIKKRSFKNILLDSNMHPVANPVISDTSTSYYIVYYGYPTFQPHGVQIMTDSIAEAENNEKTYKGLVVNNYLFQQISYIARPSYRNIIFQKKPDQKYNYSSKHFDIDYLPYAADLNKAIVTHAPGYKKPSAKIK